MKLLILTQYYPPEMGAPQARLSDLGRRLKQRGHEVTVITAIPSYPQGKIFAGYPKFYQKEVEDGLLILRCWIIPSNKPDLLHRLLSYLSFAASSFVVGMLKGGRAEVIITESPPLFLGITGWLLSRFKRANWVMNVSDLWPDSARDLGILAEKDLVYQVLSNLAHFFYRRAWLVTGQSEEIVTEIARQSPGVSTYKLSNGVDAAVFKPEAQSLEVRRKYLKEGETGLVYAGLHGIFQGLEQILGAAEQLRGEPLRFVFFGNGPAKKELVAAAERIGLTNVDFYPPVSHEEMPSVLSSMDVALITLKTRIMGAVPSKIYEAMGVGIPILLVADGEAKAIVKQTKTGVVVSPGDTEGFVKAIRGLASQPKLRGTLGKAGRQAAERLFDRARLVERFEQRLLEDSRHILRD